MSKEELTLKQKLAIIQTELIVPKKREMRNKNGKVMYKFRNLDDIFDSLKSINASRGVFFTVLGKRKDCVSYSAPIGAKTLNIFVQFTLNCPESNTIYYAKFSPLVRYGTLT